MNKDQVKGTFTESKGTVKRKLGEALGDRDLQDEGLADEAGGAIRKTYGDVKDTAKKTFGEARRQWRQARRETASAAKKRG